LPKYVEIKIDNNVLLLSEIVKADLIITGDNDLLILKSYKNTQIIEPRKYFEDYEKRK